MIHSYMQVIANVDVDKVSRVLLFYLRISPRKILYLNIYQYIASKFQIMVCGQQDVLASTVLYRLENYFAQEDHAWVKWLSTCDRLVKLCAELSLQLAGMLHVTQIPLRLVTRSHLLYFTERHDLKSSINKTIRDIKYL